MPTTYPHQNGQQAKRVDAPTFDDIVVVDGSWVPTPSAENKALKAGGRTFHSSWVDPGFDIACQAIIKNEVGVTRTGFAQGEVLPTNDETPVLYEVMNAVPSEVDTGHACVWALTLRQKDGLDLTAPA